MARAGPERSTVPHRGGSGLRADDRQLGLLLRAGLLRRRFKGVYVAGSVVDCLSLRLQILRMVVPAEGVVVDRTAGWLWAGDRMLAPNQHLSPPPLSVFSRRPGHRLRSELTDSGERRLLDRDLADIDGVAVSTPLRTACDLGRILHRDQVFAALDSLLGIGAFDLDDLLTEIARFKRYRGVVQLRGLAQLADSRSQSQSQFETLLRLRWYDAGLHAPEVQVEVETPWGASYWLDIGLADELFAAEYDGERFYGDEAAEHDDRRRGWMRRERDWEILVFRKDAVSGPRQDAVARLSAAWRAHRGT